MQKLQKELQKNLHKCNFMMTPPLDFADASELVKTALARRGFTEALPTDVAPYGRVEGRLEGRLDGQRRGFR